MKRTAIVIVTVLALAARASAHEDTGQMEIVRAESDAPLSIAVEVRIIYPNDGDPAEEATVTAVAEQPGGPAVAPVSLRESAPGVYGGQVTVPQPGAWNVRVTSLSPAATAEATVDVAAPATTSTTLTPSTTASPATTATTVPGSEDDDAGVAPALAVAVLVAAGLGLTFWLGVRRRRNTGA